MTETRILSDGVARQYSADELHKRVVDLENALRPFATFGSRLLDGRRQVPKTGPWHGLDSGAPTEANIDIEDFQRAMRLLRVKRAQRGKPA